MKLNIIAFLFLVCLSANSQVATKAGKSCSVILLNNAWLVKSYNKDEKITITKRATGSLSVHETGDVNERSFKKELIPFKIAIQRNADDTIVMFSDRKYTEMAIDEVLKKCEVGDSIMIMLLDDAPYSLPHHTIAVI